LFGMDEPRIIVGYALAIGLGISKALFGTDAILGSPWTVVDPPVIALPASVVALIVGVLLDKR
jgi:hypothetical protein